MHRALNAIATTIIVCAIGVGVYAVAPVPSNDLGRYMPRPATLAKFDGWGCGVSDWKSASTTRFYKEVKLSVETKHALQTELVRDGYVKSEEDWGLRFSKRRGGFMPVVSRVLVRTDGSVICSAKRYKWRD